MSQLKQCRACALSGGEPRECQNYTLSNETCKEFVHPFDNSKGMFKRLFSTKGRIRRLEYNITWIVLWIIVGVSPAVGVIYVSVALAVIALIVWFFQFVKRMHDIDADTDSIFVPFNLMGFKAIFTEGTEGPNQYGSDPKQSYESQILEEWA
jgi:uncharacterized membrane protein YhaH (DUF805 family)